MQRLALLIAVPALWFAACGGDDAEPTSTPTVAPTLTETAPLATASTLATPATPATAEPVATQTPEPTSTPTATQSEPAASITLTEAFPGLTLPNGGLDLRQVPGTGLFVAAFQVGYLVTFPKDGPYDSPQFVLDITDETTHGFELGLLSIAFDPGFPERAYIYVYFSARTPGLKTVVERFSAEIADGRLVIGTDDRLTIFSADQPFSNHNGGTLAFGPDGMLYLGLGDGGSGGDPLGNGQDTEENLLGTVIRIDVSRSDAQNPYTVPPDNPFVGTADALDEIWVYGLRNPWRMSFDSETGALWVGDVGQDAFEEIDILRAGGNYGWNIQEGFSCFRGNDNCDAAGLTEPVAAYGHDPGCTVIGGHVYRGETVPDLFGLYVYGDFCSGEVWMLDAMAAAAGERPQPMLIWSDGPGIRSFAVDEDNELYLLSSDGTIYKFVPSEG